MLQAKGFLLEECQNVKLLLDEALRYEYGTGDSRAFYDECRSRLRTLRGRINAADPDFPRDLESLALELSALSGLITRIERSHLGEFSWPFAQALEKIAKTTCESLVTDEVYKRTLFYISADGGLQSYRIHPEQEEVGFSGVRIFNIVFPRSLKNHVLLHSILGHEVGHAVWCTPELWERLYRDVVQPLADASPMEDPKPLGDWFNKTYTGLTLDDELAEDFWRNWGEEFLCDLFGLLTIGPSFLAAHRSLLNALDPVGTDAGEKHPPNYYRFALMDAANEYLKWTSAPDGADIETIAAIDQFNEELQDAIPDDPGFEPLIDLSKVPTAVEGLCRFLDEMPGTMFRAPDGFVLSDLRESIIEAIPPIGRSITGEGHFQPISVDFRSILYAGWLAYFSEERTRTSLQFMDINRLCDHAILQQQAITHWNEHKK